MPPTQPTLNDQSRRSTRGRTVWGAAIAMVVVGVLAGGGASPAMADGCANAVLRAQNNSTQLPDCRAYELVTPSYKQGFSTYQQSFSDDGAVSFFSTANLAGNGLGAAFNPYVTRRSAAGWIATALNPPNTTYDAKSLVKGAEAMSADLRWSLFLMRTIDQPRDAADYYLRSPDATFTRIGKGSTPGILGTRPETKLTSPDLSHVVFGYSNAGGPLFEYVGTGSDGPPRSVSTTNTGQQLPTACPDAISADGRVITLTAGCTGAATLQVWARVAGTASIAVSGSQCTRTQADPGGECNDPAPANYAGVAKDGSRVLFTTTQQLVNGDTDTTSDLYACDIPSGTPTPVGPANPCSTLSQISDIASGADVDNVAAVSDNGSRVYFVAHGAVLAHNLGVTDTVPNAGVANLYLWTKDAAHPTGAITYIGPTSVSGAQTTPDGRYLVFGTTSPLVTTGPATDTDGAVDMYRYDAQTTTMTRLSTSTSGNGGNTPGFDTTINNSSALNRTATIVTADGSRVVFETREALSPTDNGTGPDVYEWHQGQVSQISGAGGAQSPWITPSGRDIFFGTGQQLTAADGDLVGDLYDARIDGGINLAQKPSCAGEDCRNQPSNPPSLTQAPTATPNDSGAPDITPAFSLKPVTANQRKQLASTGTTTLTIRANIAGTVSTMATATIAGKQTTVSSQRRTMTTPGTLTISLTLSAKARNQLTIRHKLTIKLTTKHSKLALPHTTTIKLTKTASRATVRLKRL